MPQAEIYTLGDILEAYHEEDTSLEDALFDAFQNTSAYAEVDGARRAIELTVDASDTISVDDIQNYTQHISDIVEKMSAGRVKFVGVLGGTEFRITLIYTF